MKFMKKLQKSDWKQSKMKNKIFNKFPKQT